MASDLPHPASGGTIKRCVMPTGHALEGAFIGQGRGIAGAMEIGAYLDRWRTFGRHFLNGGDGSTGSTPRVG